MGYASRDSTLTMFHALGKLLYNKRVGQLEARSSPEAQERDSKRKVGAGCIGREYAAQSGIGLVGLMSRRSTAQHAAQHASDCKPRPAAPLLWLPWVHAVGWHTACAMSTPTDSNSKHCAGLALL